MWNKPHFIAKADYMNAAKYGILIVTIFNMNVYQTMYYAINVHHPGNKLKCLQDQ